MKTILIMMIAVGLRLIYSVVFEYPALLIGFVGTGLTVFCLFALLQEFRDSKKSKKNKKQKNKKQNVRKI